MCSWLLHFRVLFVVLVVCLTCVVAESLRPFLLIADQPPNVKHEQFRYSSDPCLDCHTAEEAKEFRGRTAASCSNYCLTCHSGHHKIDIWLIRKPDVNLPLKDEEKITCYTCHDLIKKRYDDVSWRSESLFDSIFNKKDIYKTYYLRINNRDGSLCKSCH